MLVHRLRGAFGHDVEEIPRRDAARRQELVDDPGRAIGQRMAVAVDPGSQLERADRAAVHRGRGPLVAVRQPGRLEVDAAPVADHLHLDRTAVRVAHCGVADELILAVGLEDVHLALQVLTGEPTCFVRKAVSGIRQRRPQLIQTLEPKARRSAGNDRLKRVLPHF